MIAPSAAGGVLADPALAAQQVGPAKPRTGELRVQVHPGDDKGVGWARMKHPAAAARLFGLDVVEAGAGVPILRARRKTDGRMVIAPDEIDADVLVFQRPSNPEIVALIPALQARGISVVVDIDDDVQAVARRNVTWGSENARLIAKACATADVVTTSTPALAAKYGRSHSVVLENCVPASMLDLGRQSDGRTVGWSGWVGTHPDDLQVTHGGVAEAVRRTGWRFQMVGPVEGVQQALGLDTEPASTGGLPVAMFHDALGLLDVGICPLKDTAFNRSKSWLKPLEMTARGAAVVMSPLPEYVRLHDQGVGLLAKDRGRSWRAQLESVMVDSELRRELVEQGVQVVREYHTYEGNGWRWAEAWASAARRSTG